MLEMVSSSSGLGRWPLTPETGVRVPLRSPKVLIINLALFLILFTLFFPPLIFPQTIPINDFIIRLNKIKSDLSALNTDDINLIQSLTKEVNEIKKGSSECVDLKQNELDKITSSLNSLGDPVEGEPQELAKQRKILQEQKINIEKDLNGCKYLVNETTNILENLSKYHKEYLKKQFFYKDSDLFEKIYTLYSLRGNLASDFDGIIKKISTFKISKNQAFILLISFLLGLVFSRWLNVLILKNISDKKIYDAYNKISSYTYLIVSFGLVSIISIIILQKQIFYSPYFIIINVFLFSLFIYSLFKFLIDLNEVKDKFGKKFYSQINFYIKIVCFLTFFLIIFNIKYILLLFPYYIADLIKSIILILYITIIFYFLIRYSFLFVDKKVNLICKIIIIPLLLIILLLDVLGYNNLSIFSLFFLIKTSIFIILFYLIYKLIKKLSFNICFNDGDFYVKIREIFSIKKGEYFSFLIWLEFLVIAIIFISIFYFYTFVIELPKSVKTQLNDLLVNGFKIAKIQISPLKIILGLLILLLLIGLVRWFKKNIEDSLSKSTTIEKSEIDSIVTIFSYIGYVLAFFIFLASSGFDISNLALIGGALSVGIGFGLQNIVNNFVSGLILLFERPIKKGDWIVVKETEGYVKRISVRSTIIETFDRCDVIVPNSEIISSQVQNWMFEDRMGRVRISVGVAYGSDVYLVRDLLLQVANNHPLTVKDGTLPQPIVWFSDFGESSLNFTLLFYIRDIDKRLRTASDIRFEIYRVFKENNITIPFPQRDVHVYNHNVYSEV